MKHIKIFENFNNEIDEVYINELIDDFCLENDIYYVKDFYSVEYSNLLDKEDEVILENILDRNILTCKFIERRGVGHGIISIKIYLYLGYREQFMKEIPKMISLTSYLDYFYEKFPKIKEDLDVLNNKIKRSLIKDGFFLKPTPTVIPYIHNFYGFDEEVVFVNVNSIINYSK